VREKVEKGTNSVAGSFEATLQVLPHDARLHTHKHILSINPLDGIHLVHVQRDNHALLIGGA